MIDEELMDRIRTAVSGGQTVRVTETIMGEDDDLLGSTGLLMTVDLTDPGAPFQVDIPEVGGGVTAWVYAVEPVTDQPAASAATGAG